MRSRLLTESSTIFNLKEWFIGEILRIGRFDSLPPLVANLLFSALSSTKQDVTSSQGLTYAQAGVSVDAGNSLVEAIKPYVKETRRPGADGKIGGFGGVFDLKAAGYLASDGDDTLLVAGTDGVGTKLRIALESGIHDTVGNIAPSSSFLS